MMYFYVDGISVGTPYNLSSTGSIGQALIYNRALA